MEQNFEKYNNSEVDTQNTPYDYGSVMHYRADAFSSNGLPTIEPLEADVSIGQIYNMSQIDIQEVRLFYNCSASGVTFPEIPTTTSGNRIRNHCNILLVHQSNCDVVNLSECTNRN